MVVCAAARLSHTELAVQVRARGHFCSIQAGDRNYSGLSCPHLFLWKMVTTHSVACHCLRVARRCELGVTVSLSLRPYLVERRPCLCWMEPQPLLFSHLILALLPAGVIPSPPSSLSRDRIQGP